MFKVYRVNTRTHAITQEDFKDEYREFGNRGIIAKVLTDEVNPKCDPLGPENKLIVCTGMLAGTSLTTANRVSCGAKSPVTGGIKESNVGGNVGFYLVGHGIKMLIFEEMPEDDRWYIFKVNSDSSVELIFADEYMGLDTYDTVEKMHQKYGKDINVLTIGTAGERVFRVASLQATDATTHHPSRSAARGGMGAVAGSKKIKAILIEKPSERAKYPYVDKALFDKANKTVVECFKEPGPAQGLNAIGTNAMIDLTAQLGMLPTFNHSGRMYPPEMLETINIKSWLERVNQYGGKQGTACQNGCLTKCSNIYNNPDGSALTGGLEYESFAVCGPNCGMTSLDLIAEMDRFSDDLGIDAMDFGCAIGVLMDEGKIPWGDPEGVRDAMKQMREGKTELGKLLAEGTHRLGVAIGAKRIPTVKKQSMGGYDPRNLKGLGITYATNPMGADHTSGNTMGPGEHHKKEGQVALSKEKQVEATMLDNICCMMAIMQAAAKYSEVLPQLMQGALGGEWDYDKVLDIGRKTLKLEWAWNEAAGFTKDDDKLPDFMYEQPTENTQAVFDLTTEEMQEIYNL
ncbi:hypothetical protein LPY66_05675 [Dehalobacter sp. DCM]|uniref:aldehyde ferredoxin oxidoreductase N-terminal domain-containing protein n=1 Tax=Dehalobacter sp. DCM TaxID=2907827 RepID=UPI00308167BE|nr:hypothetical protein LPY66_05675 [Dehalobacter sp. DCM]